MAGNTFGRILKLTTFGESHGAAIGGILDGCPSGLALNEEIIQKELDLRKPGHGITGTSRKESDKIHILSGVFEGVTTGTPIGFYIANQDQRSRDYGNLADIFRPSHADWSYYQKYNGIRDYRGGGRASGRETAIRVAGGAVAKLMLSRLANIRILAGTVALGGITVPEDEIKLEGAINRRFFSASEKIIPAWERGVKIASGKGDTLGGIVQIRAENVPPGLGEPVFDKLDATLAYALMGVGAVKGVEIGSGFHSAAISGSLNNDAMLPGNSVKGRGISCQFASNMAGGIVGGISTGQPIDIKVAVKPIASLRMEQDTITSQGRATRITIGGRHDLAAIPRIIPVLTAMTALTLADACLLQMRMAAFA